MSDLKPCPFCGESEEMIWVGEGLVGLYAGAHSSSSECVQCYTCGARMVKNHPDEWPEEMRKMGEFFSSSIALQELREYVLNQCIEAWNRRAGDQ